MFFIGDPAAAAEPHLYVTTTGSDTQPCTEVAPCATVQHAVDLVSPGSQAHIHVGEGTFEGGVSVGADRTVTIQGIGPGTLLSAMQTGTVVWAGGGLTDVRLVDLSVGLGSAYRGGGIHNRATMSLTRVVVAYNLAHEDGGGIFNLGTMAVTDSTVALNEARYGSGILNVGQMEIRNTAVRNNTVSGSSGAIEGAGGHLKLYDSSVVNNVGRRLSPGVGITMWASDASLDAVHVTVAGNRALAEEQASGGIAFQNSSSSSITGSIIANNSGLNCRLGSSAGLTLRYTLVGDRTCTASQGRDGGWAPPVEGMINGVDPMLGPLKDNGGPSYTTELLPGSPAINRIWGADVLCNGSDQRYVARRPSGPAWPCDMGAYETQH
ncbi:choice-of-anchor Q domain-containing protein [Plantactinospora soyae]|uniref:Right handed beta helix domain-containing protein n=1 Tax=Plantactinospora soyae TaxID=1544732 RepID=A0A927QZZ0_9ACTN|nr:choice-of-anchor Q domain-containing protein [Plantactinospora soyae]MBE1490950.1 hypothetical protein [Plantactinospora soyae]